ncbi:MAG: histidine--tRNA ligase [Gammaproteobacteria bacterium]
MSVLFKAIRGMHDTLPVSSKTWHFLESTISDTFNSYGYQQIRLPILEKTDLFKRSIGESTDIVSKEMYTFEDRNGDLLTLRPEGTAGCVRAVIEHGLFHNSSQRLWYTGPMFRHERPQKGRLRQFHQFGVEAFGLAGPDIDAEIIIMCARIWKKLQLNNIKLEINTLGSSQARIAYRNQLVEYFSDHKDQLDDDSQNRLEKNPLRILDSKNPDLQNLISLAPSMSDSLDQASHEHFDNLKQLLESANVDYEINTRLVRGLDYYNSTVFEWITSELGAQGTVCGGGRYDGMVEHFGGPATHAIGFGMGIERLVSLIENDQNTDELVNKADIYFVVAGDAAKSSAISLAEKLRDELPQIRLIMHCGGGSFKSQFKKADKSGAKIALILGDSELENQKIGVKHLREVDNQQEVSWPDLANVVRQLLDI